MNDKTFEIEHMTPERAEAINRLRELAGEIEEKGRWLPLTDDQALKLEGMNRAQRRAWLRKQRKEEKRAKRH